VAAPVETCSGADDDCDGLTDEDGVCSGVTPFLIEDFSSYSSTPNMISDPRGIYNVYEDVKNYRMVLDTSVGYGASSQSLRYDYPANGDVAWDYTISRQLALPSLSEIWIEVHVIFESTWSLDVPTAPGGAAFKFLFVNINGSPGRWSLEFEYGDNGRLSAFGPADAGGAFTLNGSNTSSDLFDGQWHTIRYHIRLASTDSHEFWIDGNYQGSKTGDTSSTFRAVSLARNLNKGPLNPQSLWWGLVEIYDQDPGW